MISARYAPGSAHLIVTATAVAVLPPDVPPELVERLWGVLSEDDADTAASSLADMPAFALITAAPGGAHVALRGDLAVRLSGEGGAPETLTGTDREAVLERHVAGAQRVELVLGWSVPAPTLPLIRGVALVSSVALALSIEAADMPVASRRGPGSAAGEASAAPDELSVSADQPVAGEDGPQQDRAATGDDVAEVKGPTADPIAAAGGAAAAEASADGDEADVDEGVPPVTEETPASGVAEREAIPAETTGPGPAPVAEGDAEEPGVGERDTEFTELPDDVPEDTASGEAVFEREVGDETTGASAEEEQALTDTIAVPRDRRAAQDTAARIPRFETPPRPPLPAAAAAGSADAAEPLLGDHDGETVLPAELRRARAGAHPTREGDHDGATVSARAAAALRTGAQKPSAEPAVSPAVAAAPRVLVSNGVEVELDRPVIVGRRPRSARGTGADMPHLIAVESPMHDISRNHVEIRLEFDSAMVTDLNSTNGTTLLRDGDRRRLHPGERTVLIEGDGLDLGEGIVVTFEGLP